MASPIHQESGCECSDHDERWATWCGWCVQAIKALCLKYPRKHRVLLKFLSHMLREEGGPEFKLAIVEAIVTLIQQIDDAKEPGLLHLAEFIEDCEFTTLAVQVRGPSPALYAC